MAAINLQDRHVLITGASRGLGAALTREFVARGARVTAVARESTALRELEREHGATVLPADLTDPAMLDGLVARAEAVNGPLAVLCNNAAVMIVGRVAEETSGRIRSSVDLNVTAPMELCRQAVPSMSARGSGRIVNVSSLGGVTPMAEIATYGATKAALSQFTSALRRELAGTGVTATIVQLGEIAGTDLMEGVRESPRIAAMSVRLEKLRAFVPLTPEGVASDIADATVAGRAFLVRPARATPLHLVREVPGRVSDAIFYRLDT